MVNYPIKNQNKFEHLKIEGEIAYNNCIDNLATQTQGLSAISIRALHNLRQLEKLPPEDRLIAFNNIKN